MAVLNAKSELLESFQLGAGNLKTSAVFVLLESSGDFHMQSLCCFLSTNVKMCCH